VPAWNAEKNQLGRVMSAALCHLARQAGIAPGPYVTFLVSRCCNAALHRLGARQTGAFDSLSQLAAGRYNPYKHIYGKPAMKTTLELPDELMRAVKIRAAERSLKLKDVVADALRAALASPGDMHAGPLDPVQALARRLIFLPDGTVNNPAGLDDVSYFDALEVARADSRRERLRDPLEGT
jgi:plasmid stability protein